MDIFKKYFTELLASTGIDIYESAYYALNREKKTMRYRKLGKTGLSVSVLGFGLMRLPLIDKELTIIES